MRSQVHAFLGELNALSRVLGRLACTLGGRPPRKRAPRRPWTDVELETIRRDFPRTLTTEIAKSLGRSACSIYQAANKLGLCKDPAFVLETNRRLGAALAQHPKARANQFKPGTGAGGLKTETARRAFIEGGKKSRFIKGSLPPTTRPVGSTRWCDGYVYKKVSDDRRPARLNWEMVHVLLWREHKGEIPKGFNVQFKNRDRADIRIDNLELVSKAENMERNTYHNWPEPLQDLIHTKAVLTRAINTKKRGDPDEND